ncbi:MAG: hypothetical protein OEW08_14465 [Gammaproteobacteria bacterium]|nr:hypothetical protein [Gammaproteobacteria bacterium]
MQIEQKRCFKYGGAAFVLSGVMFLCRGILEFIAGVPPSSGVEILAWAESEKLFLSFVSEVLFFGAVALIPAVFALYHSLTGADKIKSVIGCGIIAVVIPTLIMLLIVHGRLVYPVYDIHVNSPDVAANIVAIYYGGMHAVALLMAGATLILSISMRGVYGKSIVYLGFVTSMFDIVGAYPYLIGPALSLVCQILFSAWFVAVGVKLRTLP